MQLAVLIMGLVCRLVGCTTISPREVTSSPITSQVTSSEPHYNSNDVINGTHGISRAKPVPFREDVVTTSAPTTSSLMVESQMEGLVFPRVIPAGIVESGLNASQVVVPDYDAAKEETYLKFLLSMLATSGSALELLNSTNGTLGGIKHQEIMFDMIAENPLVRAMAAPSPIHPLPELDNSIDGKYERMQKVEYLLRDKHPENTTWYPLNRSGGGTEVVNMKPGGPLKVLIHGLTSHLNWTPAQSLKHAGIFEIGDAYCKELGVNANILVVNWTELSTYPAFKYPDAVDSVYYAGKDVANFLVILKVRLMITHWNQVHIIGHSLGAHVAGVAGYWIWKMTHSKVGRITGLDPAGPLFSVNGMLISDSSRALDSTDAKFVDIVHTNMGELVPRTTDGGGRYGSSVAAGHVDFYPDGGELQTECLGPQHAPNACSHSKSCVYFARSIQTNLLACQCESWDLYKEGKCHCCGPPECPTLSKSWLFFGDRARHNATGKFFISMADNGNSIT